MRSAHFRRGSPLAAPCGLGVVPTSPTPPAVFTNEDAAEGAHMQTQGMAETGDGGQSSVQAIERTNGGYGARLAQRNHRAVRRATGLGWFSIALGALQLAAPSAVAVMVGARIRPETRKTMRWVGLREVASGIGILSSRSTQPVWLWARVVGDAMDIALLGKTMSSPKTQHTRTMTALGSVLAVTALDVKSAVELTRHRDRGAEEGIHVITAITVNRPRDEVYRYWRDLENLPKFMAHLESVTVVGDRSRWRAKGPLGIAVDWEAEVVADQPSEYIAWRSCAGSDVPNEGSVRFFDAPGGRGTEVRVELGYDPPSGELGAAVAKLFGAEPSQEIAGDLRRFKQVIETGEVIHSDASIHKGPHPARPSGESAERDRQGSSGLGSVEPTGTTAGEGYAGEEGYASGEDESQVVR
jgi:uncharacterized membrane protein